MLKILFLTNNLEVAEPIYLWLLRTEQTIIWETEINVDAISTYNPDYIITYCYKHIIKREILSMYPNRFINLHPSLLPWNRGQWPVLWSYLDDTPKGASIHLIDGGIDTGPILYQKEVSLGESETLQTAYTKIQIEMQSLFKKNWKKIKAGLIVPQKQDDSIGTYHEKKEGDDILRWVGLNMSISGIKKLLIGGVR